jgi:hypothetical protein
MEEGLAIEIAPWGRAAGRPPSWTLLRPLKGWRLKIAPWGRAAEGLAIENRAVGACRRAATFVDAAPSAEGLAIDIAPRGRAAGRPPSWTSPCPPWTSPRPLRHMEDAMRRNKLALCLYLVWTTDEQDASAPAPAGARSEARQGRCQSLVREAVKEDSPAPAGTRSEARQGRCQSLVREAVKEDSPAPAGARSEARQGRCQSLVREAVKEDSPAPAGARSEARQGRCQSLLLRDSAECKTTSHLLCCFISWTEFPARAHTSVHPFTLSSYVQPATCNGRPTSHVPPATCNLQPSSPLASRLSPLTRQ